MPAQYFGIMPKDTRFGDIGRGISSGASAVLQGVEAKQDKEKKMLDSLLEFRKTASPEGRAFFDEQLKGNPEALDKLNSVTRNTLGVDADTILNTPTPLSFDEYKLQLAQELRAGGQITPQDILFGREKEKDTTFSTRDALERAEKSVSRQLEAAVISNPRFKPEPGDFARQVQERARALLEAKSSLSEFESPTFGSPTDETGAETSQRPPGFRSPTSLGGTSAPADLGNDPDVQEAVKAIREFDALPDAVIQRLLQARPELRDVIGPYLKNISTSGTNSGASRRAR